MHWHLMEGEEVLRELASSHRGLSSQEARERLERYGPNELEETGGKTPLAMLLAQFSDFMILVLIAAAVVAGAIGEVTDSLAIATIVVLNAVTGFVQEYRAEKAVQALKKMAEPTAVVIRDRMLGSVPASQLVPGDIVLLDTGRVVPADLRLLETTHLRVDESALTGESVPAEKQARPLHGDSLPLGDRRNMAYLGTFVTYGRALGVVVATGMDTELGRIAAMLQGEGEGRTPLQKRLAGFGRTLTLAILAACIAYLVAGVVRGEAWLLMFLTAIALAVAAIPEALPAVVTITLALGAKRMTRQNALVRRLPAVETLGSVTFICSDKTGTLTLNRMVVEAVYLEGELLRESDLAGRGEEFLRALALCNDARLDSRGEVIGDPTEAALLSLAEINGFDRAEQERMFPRLAEIPFEAERKCMTTFHRSPEGRVITFTKGAAEVMVGLSSTVLVDGVRKRLDADEMHEVTEKMAREGLRVLGIGMKEWESFPGTMDPEEIESDLTLLGLVGIIDPPREEALEAVSLCRTAGIRPVMITGDHPVTAAAVARRLGILDDGGEALMTGDELEAISMEEFEARVEHVQVYARVAPEQKLKIVRALKDRGQVVAMTGDGVNDAPALKAADIGVAMGVAGTDVAKEASDMILLDDNFATIVRAVREGRRIYDNILKFLKYTMASNAGTLLAVFVAPFFALPLPLRPVQILWMNLLCDSLPGLALTVERAEEDVMTRPPVLPGEQVLSKGRAFFMLRYGMLIGALTLLLQAWAHGEGMHWQTMVFTSLLVGRMAVAMVVRSEKESLFRLGLFSNPPLLGAALLIVALQAGVVYLPFCHGVFLTEPLTLAEFALSCALFFLVLIVAEAEKAFLRRRH
ncbi:MAG: cation-translocating P-type ATPase [Actinobacteria bacterium]|nr:cation-translocating P-type ATPase [Actinomycetota bacterium]